MSAVLEPRTEQVTVEAGRFDVHLWTPPAGRGPGLLLVQEIFGCGSYVRAVAARLAGLGYVVGAPDLFWRINRNWESDHSPAGLEASLAMVSSFDAPQGVADCVAALHALDELDEVTGRSGVIGFCLGGTMAYLTAAAADPACCVSYYGSGVPSTLDQLDHIRCPMLLHFGDEDAYIPTEQVEAVKAAVAGRENITLNIEHAGHAFDNHESEMFWNEPAARSAWAVTTDFLARHLPVG